MRRSTKRSIEPELTLQSVWDDSIRTPPVNSNGNRKDLSKHLQCFNSIDQESILNELLNIESESLRRNDRLRYIRKSIMDLIDRKYSAKYLHHLLGSDVHNSSADRTVQGSQTSLERALADCKIQIAILQAYIQGKYGDANQNDWFDQYEYLSDNYHATLLHKTDGNGEKPFYFNGTPLAPSKENFHICREKCLNSHVSQQFNLQANHPNWLSRLVQAFKGKSVGRKLIS
jgi:hypothetical protein